jgi:hypothetical protein
LHFLRGCLGLEKKSPSPPLLFLGNIVFSKSPRRDLVMVLTQQGLNK